MDPGRSQPPSLGQRSGGIGRFGWNGGGSKETPQVKKKGDHVTQSSVCGLSLPLNLLMFWWRDAASLWMLCTAAGLHSHLTLTFIQMLNSTLLSLNCSVASSHLLSTEEPKPSSGQNLSHLFILFINIKLSFLDSVKADVCPEGKLDVSYGSKFVTDVPIWNWLRYKHGKRRMMGNLLPYKKNTMNVKRSRWIRRRTLMSKMLRLESLKDGSVLSLRCVEDISSFTFTVSRYHCRCLTRWEADSRTPTVSTGWSVQSDATFPCTVTVHWGILWV